MDSKAEYQLSNALELDKKYKKLFIEKGAFNEEVEKCRNILRNSFEQIFLIDLNYAVSNDIESSLWRNIFYLVIDDYRKKNKEYKRAYSTLTPERKFEFKVYSSLFHSFIKESINFYTDFIQKLTKLYSLSQVSRVFKPIELSLVDVDIEPLETLQINEKTKEIAIKVCHQTLIYLGDLIRYAEMYSEVSYKNWGIAENYYQMAIQLIPFNGNPFNQLAVIASYELKSTIAIENYMRSLVIKVPFSTSSDNLYLAIEKVKSKKDILKEKFKNRQYPNSFSKAYITSLKGDFLNDYERLISYTYGNSRDMSKFLELKTYIIDILPILLETKILDTDTLITLTTINMALHYLLINKHLTKLCKIKKENIPSDFDEPQPMDDMMKEELLKFNIEFFNTILIVALRKENTITVNGSTFSYANAVSQDDHKKKQVNEEDKEMTYKNLMDLVVNIIIYTQWCKVKLSEGCSILIDNKEWMINLKEVLKIVNDIAPIKVETLINNKKQELFVSENGYFLFKNAVYLRGFIPLLDNDAHNNEKVLGTSYYKNFEDILSNTNDVVNNQIQYLIKLAYELSSISNGNLLFSLKENPINHKVKLIFTNSKEEALKINGVNVLTGKTSYESLSNLNDENNDNDDDDDDSMTETIVFTGRNKGNKTPPNEPKAENKVVEQTINKNSEPSNHESNKGDSVSEKIPKPLTINKMTDSNKGKSDLPIKRIIDEKDDDLDISMDIKNIIGDTCELPSEQTNNYRNDTNVMNLMENINNQTPSTAFISNTTTPSGLFSPFDWNKDYAYPFTNSSSIIPVQNPNKTGNDPLNTSRKDSSHDKLKEKGNTPVDFGYKWLQNQNMYAQPSNYIGNKHKSYDENTLNMPKIMNTEDHPSIPPGLSVQTKNKVPQMFNSSAPSSANSDNFVSADIFNRIENQSKLNTPITSNSNYNISNKNDDGNTISPNEFNPLQPPTQKASTVPTQSIPSQSSSSQNQPTSTTPHAPLQSPQSNVQPIQPPTQDFSSLNSSNLTTPIGLTESPSQNLLNNPLFMPPKPQTSLTFPPFPNPQITPQKQNLSSQQSTPSHLQSPLYLQNNSSSINSPVTQIFLTNQIPPPFQSLVQNSNMNNSPEQLQTTSGTKPLPNSTLQNPLFSLPYTSQIYPPGFNPSLLQAQSQSQPPSQPLTSLPNNLTGNNLAGNIPKNLPGTMPVNSNIPMPLGMGTMNNNLFGNVPLANFPNVDPRLMGMPSNPTNLNPLNNLLLNPAAALQSLASSNHQAPPNSMVPPMNLPLGMNVNPPNSTHPISQSSTSVSDGNGNSNDNGNNNGNPQAVNPLFFLNNPLSFNSVGNGMFYDDNTTSTNNLKPI